jgi:hypothetical protein
MYRLDVTLRNETADDVEIVIPRGTVFEGMQIGGNPMQNLRVVRDYRVVLGPQIEITLYMDGQCINPSLPPPRNWPMRPSVFIFP